MSTKGGGRGGRGMTGHGITPHGMTTRLVLTLAVQFMPKNGVTTRSSITPAVQSTPNNDPEQNSSAALHISESEQPNESLTPEDAPVTKQVRGRTKGLALAKIRRRGEKVKLGFSRMLGQPTSDNEDDLTRYTRVRYYCSAICSFTGKKLEGGGPRCKGNVYCTHSYCSTNDGDHLVDEDAMEY